MKSACVGVLSIILQWELC